MMAGKLSRSLWKGQAAGPVGRAAGATDGGEACEAEATEGGEAGDGEANEGEEASDEEATVGGEAADGEGGGRVLSRLGQGRNSG